MYSTRNHIDNRFIQRAARTGAGLIIALAVVLTSATGTAGASAACGEFSVEISGTQLLNDGVNDIAGPFAIDLPAGTYAIEMRSFDGHDEHPGQTDQTAEQWFAVLDSGYSTPLVADIPDESNYATSVFSNQQVPASSSMTVRHAGAGNINSVYPTCIGFTSMAPQAAPADEAPAEVKGAVEEQPTTPVEAVPTEVKGLTETPGVRLASSIGIEQPEIAEVRGDIEMSAPVLALTGPSTTTVVLVLAGMMMIAVGSVFVRIERRAVN